MREPVWTTRLDGPGGPAQIAITGAGGTDEYRTLAAATQTAAAAARDLGRTHWSDRTGSRPDRMDRRTVHRGRLHPRRLPQGRGSRRGADSRDARPSSRRAGAGKSLGGQRIHRCRAVAVRHARGARRWARACCRWWCAVVWQRNSRRSRPTRTGRWRITCGRWPATSTSRRRARASGVIGQCFTGGFALAAAVDDSVLAPVLSQPSLPLPLTPSTATRSRAVRSRAEDRRAARRQRGTVRAGPAVQRGRRWSPGARFKTLKDRLGDAFEVIEIDSRKGNAHGIGRMAHSVLTA